jgi:hypothetical protein
MEKAVKYSEREREGVVSYSALKKALQEMKMDLRITENDVKKIQKPERILTQLQSIGTPSGRRILENMTSLNKRIKTDRNRLIQERNKIEKAKELVSKMERALRV